MLGWATELGGVVGMIRNLVPAPLFARWASMTIDWSLCLAGSYTIGPIVCLSLIRLLNLPGVLYGFLTHTATLA